MNETEEIYKENIIEHYKHPQNKGKINKPDIKKKGYNPLCGDYITLYIKIKNEIIEDIKFEGEGCAISQASASLLSEEIKGKTKEEIKQLTKENIFELIGIRVSPVRMKCALLSLKTLQEGMEQWH